jgi:GNAT superfamily N-acetyltransferase
VSDIEIVPLAAPTWPSLASLFEKGGDPARCWCAFWRFPQSESAQMSTADNRSWLESQAVGRNGELPAGLVALADGQAVGWVSMAPRERFRRLARSRGIPMIDGEDVWSVTCFVVDKSRRGRGLSSELIDAAAGFAKAHGAAVIEAYPVAAPSDARVPAAAAYTGIESLFLRAGFERVAETTSTAGGFPRVVVRRSL